MTDKELLQQALKHIRVLLNAAMVDMTDVTLCTAESVMEWEAAEEFTYKLRERLAREDNGDTLLRQFLAEAKAAGVTHLNPARQEPVAVVGFSGLISVKGDPVTLPLGTLLYTTPQPREWVGLTENDVEMCLPETIYTDADGWIRTTAQTFHDMAHAIDDKLRQKNT